MTPLTFTVPGPPVPWMRAGSRDGRRFTPPRQRQYQALVRDVARLAVSRAKWPALHPSTRYAVTLVATYADRRHRDIDRIGNQILDALNGTAWHDDSQIDDLHVTRRYGTPGLDVTITAMHCDAVAKVLPKGRGR